MGESFKTCINCRNKRNKYNHKRVSDTASTRTPDTIEDETYIIVIAVETNGFIKARNAQPASSNISQFPHIVQCSWDVIQNVAIVKRNHNLYYKTCWVVGEWVVGGCHGVSQEKAESEGIDTKELLTQYKHYIDNRCMMLVCHNVDFDVRVVAG